MLKNGASAVILADNESSEWPIYEGLEEAAEYQNTDFKIFGKPATRKYRRMGVALANGTEDCSILVSKAIEVAKKIKVN